ncbi:hypothetical protein Strain138_000234 [Pseudogemmatithrix spongiicola]|uniref:Uncharacterized protein n=1 Tax=Pseudogemmatithrix spongiicola TaxID=3062599 RepID=A0AA49JXW7_9BACT|nr:hypothetical protein Strain138_000234 [Gemmatimonadaceae bacterium 'strain 138']WKW13910.1 hypothetical protein Strain318_000234 [Gemmatimonadaceae bacterium 'strain 318']
MDVMVQIHEGNDERATVARVNAVHSRETLEAPTREIVTLYGEPTPESLALALAATVEARKASRGEAFTTGEIRIVGDEGAVGETAYTDRNTGEIIKRELSIPLTVLTETAQEILREGGQGIRRLLANLLMPEWPEGTRRALGFQFASSAAPVTRPSDQLAAMREADAQNFADDE